MFLNEAATVRFRAAVNGAGLWPIAHPPFCVLADGI
jgi:hypothetical protein